MPPWEKYANPAGNYGPDPYKVNDEQRKQQAAALAAEAAARAAAAADRANNNSAVSNANSQEMTKLAREKFEFDKKKGGGAADTQKMANLRALERQIEEVRGLYNRDLKGGGLLESLGEYLPFAENRAFDSAGKALAETGFGAFRVPGVGSQSDAEGARFVEAYAPSASDQDSVIEQKITNLENRLRDTYREMGIEPRQPEQQSDMPMAVAGAAQPPAGPQGPDTTSPIIGSGNGAPLPGGFAPYGAKTRIEADPARAGLNSEVLGMIKGRVSPDLINQHILNRGGVPANPKVLQDAIAFAEKNPKWQGVDLETREVPMTGMQQFRNNAPQTRFGTAAATGLNAGGLGIPQMLAGGEGLDYLRSVNPKSAFVGDVAGVIGGTAALGKAGASVAGKFAPALLGGGKRAALARQVGTDATYGGIYGATTEGDPLTGAATAALGSGVGAGIGKGLQKTFAGGGDVAAQALRDRGIPLTVGQALGGLPKRLEDAATSIPIIGDVINARRGEGLEAFNRAAFQDAGAPIGASVNDIGESGIDALRPQISRAYDNATQGVDVNLDQQYAGDIAPFLAQGSALTGDYGAGFSRLINNRVRPALDTGQLSGANYQNMTRAMRDSRASVKGQPFAEDYIEPVQGMEAATRSLMERQGGEGVIAGLGRADAAYRNSKVLGKAVEAGRNGGRSGEVGVFAPSQLNDASVANARKFGGNGATENRPFYELATQGQAVLPSKIGDSGTPIRMLAGAGLLGTGTAGAGYAGADPATVAAPVGATALLALLGTKKGQKMLVKGLMDRPEVLKKAGGLIGRRKAQRAIGSAGAGIGVGALPYFE